MGQVIELMQTLFQRLAPMASDFAGDPEAWQLLQELSQRLLQYEAFVRLFERQFAGDVDAGRLAEALVPVYARACLNTGRLERFRQVTRSLLRDSLEADSLVWMEALFLACAGRDAEARETLGARRAPRSGNLAGLGPELRALLAARGGDAAGARALIAGAEPARLLPLSARALTLRALGEHDAAEVLTRRIEDMNAAEAFFAALACMAARPQRDPREEALRAALYQPGNPLVARISYLDREDLGAFVGAYDFEVDFAIGGGVELGSVLTLTILPDGRALGALTAPSGEAAVVQGRADGFGNLEAQGRLAAGPHVFLMKLAPRSLYLEHAGLREQGQAIHVLAPDGLPYVWRGRLRAE